MECKCGIGECCCSNDNIKCDCAVIHFEEVKKVKENLLNIDKTNKLTNLYKLFSDTTRLRILLALEIEPLCVCDVANVLDMTKSAVSHQLKILRENNLVKFDKKGKSSYYSLADDHVKKIIDIALEHVEEC